jgi:hypothetical protein
MTFWDLDSYHFKFGDRCDLDCVIWPPNNNLLLHVSWFLRHICHEGYLKAIERGDRRSGARDGDRQGLPRFTSPRWRIATSCYNSL